MYRKRQMGSLLSDLTGWNIELGNVIGSSTSQALNTLQTGVTAGATQSILSNPTVQRSLQTTAQETAAQKLSRWILANKTTLLFGSVAVAGLVGYSLSRRR